ncbi:PREDICTED: la-related protein 6C [Populus euphratica]|uniref:La-related protein 6C n=1 Tax=Populus euphratica TaxID=75702 RepID=A0AAJ6SZ19_POPEU|nr:PREDICTED: la-related protein 6C [Populus euphratica]
MAPAQPERKTEEIRVEKEMKETTKPKNDSNKNSDSVSFKFNAQAPEFVPRSHTNTSPLPISGYFYPCFHYFGATDSAAGGSDWIFVGDQDHAAAYLISNNPNHAMSNCPSKNRGVLTDDLREKIIKQVEYQLSDMSLLANESMSKHVSKDPEGYVPIAVIASTKKMRSLISDNDLLAQALKSSSKLVLAEDGKKVKRKLPFTDKDREELQSRIVVVENLPDDHSHQNVQKIFSVIGSAKTIRICHPQESNSSRAKNDFFVTNKLHALVELETRVIAEKAVEKLNDERNWRKGLRVRLLLRCSPKSVLTRGRKSEFDNILEEEDSSLDESTEDTFQPNNSESAIESCAEDNPGASKKARAKGRGKGKDRGQIICARGMLAPPKCGSTPHCEASPKKTCNGPRMPDGTKGFTVGRGKPLVTSGPTSSMME